MHNGLFWTFICILKLPNPSIFSFGNLLPYLSVLVPIVVPIVLTIFHDGIFGYLIYFLLPILSYWYLIENIYTDIMSPFHLQNLLDHCTSTQTQILEYIYNLSYLKQCLMYLFTLFNLLNFLKLSIPAMWFRFISFHNERT